MGIDYTAIGKRIKEKRIQLKMPQDTLSEKIEMSASHVSHIETGKTKLSLPTLIEIANILNTTVDDLLCDNVVHSKPVFEREVSELLMDCNELEIRAIVEVAKATKVAVRKMTQSK